MSIKKNLFDYFDEMLSNQNERVLKTLFNIKLVSDNNNDDNNNKKYIIIIIILYFIIIMIIIIVIDYITII